MRILAVTTLYPRPNRPTHGAFHRNLLRTVVEAGHDVALISPVPWTERSSGRGVTSRMLARDDDGLLVCRPRFLYPPGLLRHRHGDCYLASLRPAADRVVREFRPEVVLGLFAYPDGWAALRLARRYGLPSAVKVCGSDVLIMARGARRAPIGETLRAADAVLAVSLDLAEHVASLGVGPDRVGVIPEGIDATLFHPGGRAEARRHLGLDLGPETPLVLFVGNLVPGKGVSVLLDACAALVARGHAPQCRIVGRGPEEARLRRLVERLGLADRVQLVGPQPHAELAAWYRACDVVALPSFSEGIPNVLREALASGRPYVATRVGGIPEIADPSACRLVAAGSAPELAEALGAVLADPPAEADVLAWAAQVNIGWDESAARLTRRLQALAGGAGPADRAASSRIAFSEETRPS